MLPLLERPCLSPPVQEAAFCERLRKGRRRRDKARQCDHETARITGSVPVGYTHVKEL